MTSEKSVRVYVENVPYQADELYEYALPPSLEEIVCVGSLVCCPFGRGSRTVRAIVVSVGARTEGLKLKEIGDVFGTEPALDEKQLRLCSYMKERCFCTFFEAAKTVMAPGAVGGFERYIRMETPVSDGELCAYFSARGGTVPRKNVLAELGKEKYAKVLRLVKAGQLCEPDRFRQRSPHRSHAPVRGRVRAARKNEKFGQRPKKARGPRLAFRERGKHRPRRALYDGRRFGRAENARKIRRR